jgi:hypothetical protein
MSAANQFNRTDCVDCAVSTRKARQGGQAGERDS